MGAYLYLAYLLLMSMIKGALTGRDCPDQTCLDGFHCCPDNLSCCMDDDDDDGGDDIGKYVGIGFGCFAIVVIFAIIIGCCKEKKTVYRRIVTETVVHPPLYGSFGENSVPTTTYTETTYHPPQHSSFGKDGVSSNPHTQTTYQPPSHGNYVGNRAQNPHAYKIAAQHTTMP